MTVPGLSAIRAGARILFGIVAAIALVLSASSASSARAAVASDPTPGNGVREISAEWDGDAVHLDWAGAAYARAEASFIGERRAVPGDLVVRTLTVVNAGPSDGLAKITLDLNVVVPHEAANPDLAENTVLFWNVDGVEGKQTFAEMHGSESLTLAEIAVRQGAAVRITVGFEMSADVESSRAAGTNATALDFEIGVNLSGATDHAEGPTLAVTGATWLVVLAVGGITLLILGGLMLARRLRQPSSS